MTEINIPEEITKEVIFDWNGRKWRSITDAMTVDEMASYLSGRSWFFVNESREKATNGGVFDVTSFSFINSNLGGTFKTYYIHKQNDGTMRRLFRSMDIRELYNGATW